MTRKQYRTQMIALILSFLIVSTAGLVLVGTASAQETNESDENTSESESEGSDTDEQTTETTDTNGETNKTYTHVFDRDNVRIVSEHWEGETYVAEIEAVNRPETVTVTDAGRDLTGGVTVDRETYTISTQGTTEVRFTVVEDREVTVDPGYGNLYGTAPEGLLFSAPDLHSVVSAAIGLLMAFLLITEIARRSGKLSKRRVVEA